jgi:CHAD domain-containing protein
LNEGIRADPVTAVHSARKAVKKERALLRLSRDAVAPPKRRRENAALREAARQLSDTRDAEVLVQALDFLSERYAGQLPEVTFAAFRQELEAGRDLARERLDDPTLASAVVGELAASRSRIAAWRLKRGGWKAIEGGLLRTYKRGQKAFGKARAEPDVEHLHEWRKRAKDLWYDLRLLAPVCGQGVRGQAKDAHALADLLGDDHDLAVLRQSLLRSARGVPADLDAVLALVDHRREQLLAQAIAVGESVYAEKPKAFGRRMRRCWRAGRARQRAQSPDPGELADATRAVGVS